MTISLWYMSNSIYGDPDWSIGQSGGGTFTRLMGDRGNGLYKWYNPSATTQVSVTWEMSQETYADFTTQWNDNNVLNKGANWFTHDMPLQLDFRKESTDVLPIEMRHRFAVEVGFLGTPPRYGWRAPSSIGAINPSYFAGQFLNQLTWAEDTDATVFDLGGYQFPNSPDTIGLDWRTGDGAPPLVLTWDGSSRYTKASTAPNNPDIATYLAANLGEVIGVDVLIFMRPFQRYICNFNGSYQADFIGGTTWKVSADLEVDTSPQPTIG